ncbi:hypothetical protein PIB30_055089 [Stylosanthes scabra]|uniref:Protein XRI1 n=1 Tax=Stylosanthes scabra TaxID=79078 RepID=A0ABU6RJN6_9FABA|nr:hypothetical protein [Stylosanthes scabra]
MNELHYSSLLPCYNSSSLLLGSCSSSSSWDYHNNINLGVLNADKFSLVMPEAEAEVEAAMHEYGSSSSSEPSFSTQGSAGHADFSSTGYLEDALLEFGEPSKRRRLMLPFSHDNNHHQQYYCKTTITTPFINNNNDIQKSLWNLNPTWHQPVENFHCTNQNIESIYGLSSDEDIISTFWSRVMREEANILVQETTTTILSGSEESPNNNSTSSCSNKATEDEVVVVRKKKKKEEEDGGRRKVVYPFAMVKPGGREGDVTLNDINERILMAPTRPVKHPVGDYACRPCVSAVQGSPGLSGKAVVALTRIHTLGRRGTITIIRTKG